MMTKAVSQLSTQVPRAGPFSALDNLLNHATLHQVSGDHTMMHMGNLNWSNTDALLSGYPMHKGKDRDLIQFFTVLFLCMHTI